MNRSAGAAAKPLPESERKQLAVQALAGSEAISELSARLGVSRKFVYTQRDKASEALDEALVQIAKATRLKCQADRFESRR
jgi:transposase